MIGFRIEMPYFNLLQVRDFMVLCVAYLIRYLGSITSHCSGIEPALTPFSGDRRPDSRKRRKSSLYATHPQGKKPSRFTSGVGVGVGTELDVTQNQNLSLAKFIVVVELHTFQLYRIFFGRICFQIRFTDRSILYINS